MDLSSVEEHLWFVQWRKCSNKWSCTSMKERQYYMDSCEEELEKRQHQCEDDEQICFTYRVFDVKMSWSKEKIELRQWVVWSCRRDWINRRRNDQVLWQRCHKRNDREDEVQHPICTITTMNMMMFNKERDLHECVGCDRCEKIEQEVHSR